MKHARYAGLAALLLVLVLATVLAGSLVAPAGAATRVKHVTIQNFSFVPRTITVKAGTKVVWKNVDSTVHQLASTDSIKTTAKVTGLFASGQLTKGATFSFRFKKKGTFYYECTIHASMASMHGKVVVK